MPSQNPLLQDDPRYAFASPNNALAPQPTWADAAQWHGQNLADTWSAVQNPQTWVDAAGQYGNALLMGTTAPGIRAFHGSPYDFERFNTSQIGTGEGAQAYGHGLYFAEKEATAKSYRDTTSDAGATVGGQPYDPANINHVASYYLHDLGGGDKAATLQRITDESNQMQAKIDNLKSMYPTVTDQAVMNGIASPYVTAQQRLGMVRDLVANNKQPLQPYVPPGKMYEVNINADPAHFLDWDTPFEAQSKHVQDALTKVQGAPYPGQKLKGSDYAPLSAEGAQQLLKSGIPGIRYLDQGSRGAGEGTHNYVVFDANTIDILRKYGLAGLIAGGGAAAAGTQQQSQ